MTLLNGMPATFVEVAYGSGFDARKEYAIVWADGQRGVVLVGNGTHRRRRAREEAREAAQTGDGSPLSLEPAVASSASRRSSSKSSTSSMPTDRRSSPSVTPRRSRSCSGIDPCVMRAGMADQRFDAAQALGQAEVSSAGLQNPARARRPFELERDHAAEAAHLALRELVLRMRAQARIVDARDVVARFQETRRRSARCARARACAARASLRRASSATHRAVRERRRPRSAGSLIRSCSAASSVMAMPPTTSL